MVMVDGYGGWLTPFSENPMMNGYGPWWMVMVDGYGGWCATAMYGDGGW
jgi:hypothetical protein